MTLCTSPLNVRFIMMPRHAEAGTGNIADAVGLGAAVDYVERLGIENIAKYEHDLLGYATQQLLGVPGLKLIGTAKEKASVLSLTLAGYSNNDVGAGAQSGSVLLAVRHHCVHNRFFVDLAIASNGQR